MKFPLRKPIDDMDDDDMDDMPKKKGSGKAALTGILLMKMGGGKMMKHAMKGKKKGASC